MSIISVQTVQVGLVGVLPSVAYINTTNTVAEVTTTGFLNKEVAAGTSFQMPCLAVVATKSSPTAAPIVGTYNVVHVGEDWSLSVASNDSIALPSAQILVGNAGGVATPVAMSGVIAITNTGLTSIVDGSIVNADINAAAAIAYSKLAALPSAQILVGSAGNVATAVAMSGDVAISNAGLTTIQAGAIDLAMLSAGITPAYVIKLGGKDVSAGGSATVTITATGVVPTDLAFAAIQASANAVNIQTVTAGTNQVIVVCSGDPGAATICWSAERAAS